MNAEVMNHLSLEIILMSFFVFLLFRRLFKSCCSVPIAGYLKLSMESKNDKPSQYDKFIEDSYYTFYYILSCFYFLMLVYRNDYKWIYDLNNLFDNMPHIEEPIEILIFYHFQIGYYLSAIFYLIFVDERLDDFSQMLLHHLITLALLLLSVAHYFHRIGIVIVFIHDIVDVFLYTAKTFHDAGYLKCANVSFGLFIIALPIFRIYILFRYTLLNALVKPHYYANNFYYRNPFTAAHICFWLGWWFVFILFIFHQIWFYRSLKLLWKLITTGEVKDDRYVEKKNN